MSEAEIERIKARIAGLGELGKSIDAKLCWLADKNNVAEILETAKKDLFDYWRRNLIHEGLEKWFGSEPQK